MSDVAKKCQYAGDPNDEYCKSCNGLTMLVNGVEYPCTECTAYTPVGEGDGEGSFLSLPQAANANAIANAIIL
jgi:hypothetical protein